MGAGSSFEIAGWEVLGRIARGSTADVLLARPDLRGEVTPASLSLGLSTADLPGQATLHGLVFGENAPGVRHRVGASASPAEPRRGRVILKRLYPHLAENEEFVRMFVDEVRLMSLLRHDGIVDVYDLDEDDETFYAVLELVDGPSLSAALRLHEKQTGSAAVDVAFAAAVAARVAAALDVVHNARDPQSGAPLALVHRDVNPQNILVGRDDVVKLADFGVARSATARKSGILAARDTNGGVLKGKASFLSPEQLKGAAVDARADLFALGVTLYRLVAGRPPFSGESDVALLEAIAHEAPPPLSSSAPRAPPALCALVHALLEKDPANRPASAAVVAQALAEFAGGSDVVGAFVRGLGLPSLRA